MLRILYLNCEDNAILASILIIVVNAFCERFHLCSKNQVQTNLVDLLIFQSPSKLISHPKIDIELGEDIELISLANFMLLSKLNRVN